MMPSNILTKDPNLSATRDLYLVILLAILGYVSFLIFAPFINIVVVAFIIVELFYPVYKFLLKYLRSKALSTTLTTIISFAVVIIPLVIIILITASEAVNFSRQAQQYLVNNNLIEEVPRGIVTTANNFLASISVPPQYRFDNIDLHTLIGEVGTNLASTAGNIAGQILSGGLGLLFQAFLLIVCLLYLFVLRGNLRQKLSEFSPLDDRLDHLFYDKFVSTTRAVVKGSVLVALAQATAVTIMMVIMGVGSPIILWLVMLVASLIPIGSGIVWAPLGILMILGGQPAQGIFLLIYSAVIINVIEGTLRPYLMKNTTHLHPLVTLLSVLGGIYLFGGIGILYGPLIIVFFLSLMHVYKTQRVSKSSEPELSS